MARLTGREAIAAAERTGRVLGSYSDPTSEGRDGLTVAESREIASQDPGLVYLDVTGDWVVAGRTSEDRDVGQIVSLHGATATVAWLSGTRTDLDLSGDDVEIYCRREQAEARRAELDS